MSAAPRLSLDNLDLAVERERQLFAKARLATFGAPVEQVAEASFEASRLGFSTADTGVPSDRFARMEPRGIFLTLDGEPLPEFDDEAFAREMEDVSREIAATGEAREVEAGALPVDEPAMSPFVFFLVSAALGVVGGGSLLVIGFGIAVAIRLIVGVA